MNIAIAMIIAIALTIASGGAESNEPDIREVCGSYSELARTVMTERQRGASMREMMERADGREPNQTMVVQAYGISKKMTQKYQMQDISQFADAWYLDCARYFETR